MIPFDIELDGDNCWPDLAGLRVVQGELVGGALLKGGTVSGKHTVTLRVALPDGSVVLAQTTLALLAMATRAFTTRAAMQGQVVD